MIGLNDIKRSWLKDFQHSASHEIACTSIYIPIDELTFEQIFSSCLTLQTPHLGFKAHLSFNLTLGLFLEYPDFIYI